MNSIKDSIKILLVMIVIMGVIYPLLITVVGIVLFNKQANGSIIYVNNRAVGSELIGQNFLEDKYFQGRPSAADYETLPSGASNKSVTNAEFNNSVKEKYKELSDRYKTKKIPQEMYTASGSGLDPHISKEAAMLQIDRIAHARKMTAAEKEKLIEMVNKMTEKKDFGIFGEERVNVLKLNVEID